MTKEKSIDQIPKTTNLTSSWTLFLKYFMPTMWIVFFGTMGIIFFTMKGHSIGGFPAIPFRIGYAIFLILGFSLLYFTVMNLKRVEADNDYVYITNYLKIFKYPYFNVEKVTEKNYSLFKTATVHLIEPGHFGKKATFLIHKKRYPAFLEQHPHFVRKIVDGNAPTPKTK